MASPANSNQQPSQQPFDMQKFFKPTNLSTTQNPNPNLSSTYYPISPSSYPPLSGPLSYPPQTLPFHHQFQYHPPSPRSHQQIPFSQDQLPANSHQLRSVSYPTPPLQSPSNYNISPPQNNFNSPNSGARIMALLGAPSPNMELSNQSSSGVHDFSGPSTVSVVPTIPMPINPTAPIRMPSSKLPKGRHLIGDHVMYDVDVRLQGEVQPQLEVTPITKYASDPQLVLGRQIAVNKSYICYGLKQGNIRVLNIHTALRSLFRGHTQRVTDMDFFAEDVHLLASVSIEGRVFVWKISEGPDEEDTPQITGKIVLAMHILGEGDALHPRLCWHCHKQEVLVIGFGKRILRIDTTKLAKVDVCSAEEPYKCPVDKLIDGVQLVGKHEGEVTDLSMCQWMTTRLVSASTDGTVKIWEDRKSQPLLVIRPHDGHPVNAASFLAAPHRPDHIILITCGPSNREVKIWAPASEEGWLLPSDSESWKHTQTLDLKCSSESRNEDAFFNQVVALPQAGLLLLANGKRNAIYGIHMEYGSNPLATRMDYIAEFTVTMPILSFTGTSISPHGEHIVQVYCVQTQAIQQYALDLCQCLPPPLENVGLDKSDSFASRDVTSAVGFGALDSSKSVEIPDVASVIPTVQVCTSESANSVRYPVSSNPAEAATSKEVSTRNADMKPVGLATASSDADVVCVPSPSLPLSPRLSGKISGLRSPTENFESGSLFFGNHAGERPVNDYSVDRKMDPVHAKILDVPTLDDDSKNDEEKVAQDEHSGVLNPPVMFKHPTHLITPSEILGAASSSEATHVVEGKTESEKNIKDMTVNGDIGNTELEVKVVGETRSTQNDKFGCQRVTPTAVSESREKYFCSQASDLGIEMTRDSCAISSERYIDDEACQVDGVRNPEPVAEPCLAGDVDHDSVRDGSDKGSDSSMPTLLSKTKKQKGKISQASIPPPSQSAVNLEENSTEAGGSLSVKAASPQIVTMQETLNQLLNMHKEMQKQMTTMVAVPVTREGKRLEAALGRSMEKAVKANNDALWARFQEENAKNDKLLRERFQQITSLISNFLNKDLQSLLEKTLRKEIAAVGTSIVRTITPTIEKTVSSAIADAFQRGVGDKAVNQLDKSVSSKLEATVARQIQAQFHTSGKQALQDAIKSNFEISVIPAFEKSCKSMFEQVDYTFQKGIAEHANAAKQHFESSHSPLALALREAVNSASSVTQTLSGELADGQRKLIALAAAGANASGVNPMVTQLNNGPLGSLHEKVEVPMDPTKELSRLISEQKYEEAFTGALQRSDVTIVSWLCSQVDLRGMLSMVPLPLSQGVLLSLLQQLACDIDKDTSRKLSWMMDVAAAINPANPMIAMHVRPIFEQVYQILHHQRSLPIMNGAEMTSVRLLMHVINSMLMTCK